MLNTEIPCDGYTDSGLSLLTEECEFEYKGYNFTLKERFGGEGKGEIYWVVFEVSKGEEKKFFMIDGWYQSYEGGELDVDTTHEVEQVEKMIKVWEPV